MQRRTADVHEQQLAAYAEWEWSYSQVAAFVRERGHCNLGEHPAGDWLRLQLQASTAGRLSPERQQLLISLGVSLDSGDAAWEGMLQRVRDVLIRRQVPRKKSREKWLPEPLDGDLAAWLREQRALHKAGMLHPERLRKLLGLKLLMAKRMPEPSPSPASTPGRIRAAEARELRHAAMWEARFAELMAYQHEHGDCDVPQSWPENQGLANWVRFQRKLDHLGRMSDARRARLDALAFIWSLHSLPVNKRWEQRFQELAHYKEQHGHTRVSKSFDKQLWHWRHVQREFRRKGIMHPVRISRLDAIGFEWEEPEAADRILPESVQHKWEVMFRQLTDYATEHGHIRVPKEWPENQSLSSWLQRQKLNLRTGKLSADRLEKLQTLGFIIPPYKSYRPTQAQLWEQRYAELAAFQQEHGHTRVTGVINEKLSEWRLVQRAQQCKGALSAVRTARLEVLGFDWVEPGAAALTHQERQDRQWQHMYEELVQFHHEHGHCLVIFRRGEGRSLPEWVKDQRTLKREGKLRPERQQRLEALGFVWEPGNYLFQGLWDRRYAQLVAFQQQHGHTRVLKGQNKQLWSWRHVQRECRKKGTLSAERISRLDAIGFEWQERGIPLAKPREQRWEMLWNRRYDELVAFKQQHGTTHVVADWKENPTLATWVGDQRERYHHGGLRPDRKERLDALGFLWKPGRPTLKALWEARYSEIVAFKEHHGHTRVPKGFGKLLWHWRQVQCEFRKKGKLSAERTARLEAIGFEWKGRGSRI